MKMPRWKLPVMLPAKRPAIVSAMALALGLAGVALPAQAGVVEVAFDQPDQFTDAGRGIDGEAVRQALASHLQALGRDGLPAGQTLRITVTDIDLAGESRPRGPQAQWIRVLQGRADWPVITLRYSLSDGPRELASGSERLIDMAYLDRQRALLPTAYPYEERLLTDWFTRRFGAAAAH